MLFHCLIMIFIYNSNCHLYATCLPLDSSFLPLNPFPQTLGLSYNQTSYVFWEPLGYVTTKEQSHTIPQRGTQFNNGVNINDGAVRKEVCSFQWMKMLNLLVLYEHILTKITESCNKVSPVSLDAKEGAWLIKFFFNVFKSCCFNKTSAGKQSPGMPDFRYLISLIVTKMLFDGLWSTYQQICIKHLQ